MHRDVDRLLERVDQVRQRVDLGRQVLVNVWRDVAFDDEEICLEPGHPDIPEHRRAGRRFAQDLDKLTVRVETASVTRSSTTPSS
jgi:hypothetical protein